MEKNEKLNYIVLVILLAVSIGFNIYLNNKVSETKKAVPVIFNTTDTLFNPIRMINPQDNLTFIKVEINGVEVILLLDSGAGSTVLDKNQITELGLIATPMGENQINGVGGANQIYEVRNWNKLKINNSEYQIKYRAADLSNIASIIRDATGLPMVGILGSDFFNENEVIFDYKENLFIVTKK